MVPDQESVLELKLSLRERSDYFWVTFKVSNIFAAKVKIPQAKFSN